MRLFIAGFLFGICIAGILFLIPFIKEAWERWHEDPAEYCIKNCNPGKYWLSNNCDRCEEIEKNEND